MVESAPRDRSAASQIPVDLDLIVRVDVRRLRETSGAPWQDLAARAWESAAADPAGVLSVSLENSDTLVAGFRPGVDLERWDYVIVLEGHFESVSAERLGHAFMPPRPLGGGFLVYDAWEEPNRLAPARLYAYRETKMIFVSPAEVDASERVIEGRVSERVGGPPARGLVSFSAPLGRLAQTFQGRSPKLARFLAAGEQITGSFDWTARGLALDARLRFSLSDDAARAARAIELVGQALAPLSAGSKSPWSTTLADRDVVLAARLQNETLAGWLGIR